MPSDLRTDASVYYGRFVYPYSDPTTPFYLVFPAGIHNHAQCFVLTSFSKDGNNAINRALTSIVPRITMSTDTDFVLGSAGGLLDEFYWFKGRILDNGENIELDMFNPDETFCTTVHLTKETKSRK
ncbi:unnamed protein product [Rhizoctonia solani]|uniref:Uncharacterized protein n=1 Tax=Rhizoctonia solani TaxID=456999 RepID=A0A8H3GJB4_9AGAM|nr:unnamed protein product [Rhizoctonia solani]